MSFHVPNRWRFFQVGHRLSSTPADGHNGAFRIPWPAIDCETYAGIVRADLWTIASAGDRAVPWEHVSISVIGERRTPTWPEMHWCKLLFWDPDDSVVQFHPPANEYVNCHPDCLHLWRPIGVSIPRPPPIAVGPGAAGFHVKQSHS